MCARLLKPETQASTAGSTGCPSAASTVCSHAYEAGLKIVLRHRFVTLMVMFGTIALTGYLYVVIPKGFFPQQDTGLIIGLSEAAQDISFQAMARTPAGVARRRACGIPPSTSVGSAIGAGGGHYHAQQRPRVHCAQAANQRDPIDQVIARLRTNLAQDPGHHALYAGRAGHHHRRRG